MNSPISKSGLLLIVSTPIGNLGDISSRALAALTDSDYVLAEDTRRAKQLLQHFGISQQLVSCYEQNESRRVDGVVNDLEQGKTIALISDAGTPLINDPGFELVRAVQNAGFTVSPIPGASSIIAALSVSGLPTDRFIYEGFLPAKSSARKTQLQTYRHETRTIVLLESTHRIVSSIEDMIEVLGEERKVSLARELTKQFETVITESLETVLGYLLADRNHTKGEFVITISGVEDSQSSSSIDLDARSLLEMLVKELSVKSASKLASELLGLPKKDLYNLAVQIKNSG
jgi:16S rRNA (cytidine1402-2'-O)-methyltransferase